MFIMEKPENKGFKLSFGSARLRQKIPACTFNV